MPSVSQLIVKQGLLEFEQSALVVQVCAAFLTQASGLKSKKILSNKKNLRIGFLFKENRRVFYFETRVKNTLLKRLEVE